MENVFEVDKSMLTGGDAFEEDRYEDDEEEEEEDNPNKRVCAVCFRIFKSGKALGGHMRIHFLVSKSAAPPPKKALKVNPTVNFKKQHKDKDKDKEEEVIPICSLCHKTFRNLKSMYGHMRCHPERPWRGIQPPLDTSNRLDDVETVSRGLFVSWPAAYKRSRSAGKPEDPEFLECVGNLLYLQTDQEMLNLNSQTSGAENETLDEPDMVLESEASILQEFVDECVGYRHHLDDDNNVEDELVSNITNQQQQQQQLEDFNIYLSPSTVASNSCKKTESVTYKYSCNVCPKSFPTYHGLGGHMSIHSKERSELISAQQKKHTKTEQGSSSSKQMDMVTGLHQCRVCNKVFSSGQALGGHKKCHRSATLVTHDQDPTTTDYTDGNLGSHANYVDLDIDLNLVPLDLLER